MKLYTVIPGVGLFGAALAAIGESSHEVHESSITIDYETKTEVTSLTDVGSVSTSFTTSVGTDTVTKVSVILTSSVVETLPGTAKHGEKTSEVVPSAIVTETTASVGSTVSSVSSASISDVVVSTATNNAVTVSSSEADSTVKVTSTVVVTTVLPTFTSAYSSMSWSTVNWTSIFMNTEPIMTTATSTDLATVSIPATGSTTTRTLFTSKLDVISTSFIASSQVTSATAITTSSVEAVESTSAFSTSTSTFTVVVTGSTRISTVTVTLGYNLTYSSKLSSKTAECAPFTVYITVGPGHSSSKPVETPSSSVITISTAPYQINSSSLNSGIGTTGVSQYANYTLSATGTGGLQPTFTGGAVNVFNHNRKCLMSIAAGLAVLFGRRFV